MLLLFLGGCSTNTSQSAYETAIDNGLENITEERFEKAEAYFEIALQEKPEDTESEAYLQQTSYYIEALNLFEQENYEEALDQTRVILEISNGSDLILEKAKQLKGEIKELQSVSVSESDVEEVKENPDKKDTDLQQGKDVVKNKAEPVKNISYEDFIGYYLHFDSEDQSHSDMITTIGRNYMTIGWWMSDFELYEILGTTIEDNVLKIDYVYQDPYEENAEEEFGTIVLIYVEENDDVKIIFDSGMEFYKKTYEQVSNFDYLIKDYLIEDMK